MKGQLRLLLWLRYRTMFRGRGRVGRVAVLLSVFLVLVPMSLIFGALVFEGTRAFSRAENPVLLTEWTHLVLFVIYMMLVVMPVIGFGSNEFYDITKLFHFPVRHRTAFLAQTIGLLFGGMPLFFLPSLLGLVVGMGGGVPLIAVRVGLVAVFLFHAVALGQMLQLVLLNLLRTRRFRELAALAAALMSASVYVSIRLIFTGEGESLERLEGVLAQELSGWFAPIPSYWVSSVLAPGAGLTQLLVYVIGFLPLTLLVVAIASHLQERAFQGEMPHTKVKNGSAQAREERDARFPLSRVPGPLRAIAGKELRLLRREPFVRTLLIQQFVFFIFPVFFAVWGIGDANTRDVQRLLEYGIYAFLFVESLLVLNLLGLDGPGVVQLLVTPIPRRSILAGKVLAYGLLWGAVNLALAAGILGALGLLGTPLTAGRIVKLLTGALSATMVLLAVGAVFSPLTPSRLTARRRGALSQGRAVREGCAVPLVRMAALMITAVLVAPAHLLASVAQVPALSLLAIVYSGAILFFGLVLGGRLLRSREERVIAVLARSQD